MITLSVRYINRYQFYFTRAGRIGALLELLQMLQYAPKISMYYMQLHDIKQLKCIVKSRQIRLTSLSSGSSISMEIPNKARKLKQSEVKVPFRSPRTRRTAMEILEHLLAKRRTE